MPLIDGISRKELGDAALQALLRAKTLAADRVFEPRPWPTEPKWFPLLLVSTPRDRKSGVYSGQFAFNTTISLTIVGRIIGETAFDVGQQLDVLSGQIEDALMCDREFYRNIQQFVTIETQAVVDTTGKNVIGEIALVFDLAVFQVFGDRRAIPLQSVQGQINDQATGTPLATANAPIEQPPEWKGGRNVR